MFFRDPTNEDRANWAKKPLFTHSGMSAALTNAKLSAT